jgi:hypothetical protein
MIKSLNSDNYDKLFRNTGIEIQVEEKNFLKVKETLTRIGIASHKTKTLYQSCHILHKQGLYGILHFKELFILDGKSANFDPEDLHRRNFIVKLLTDWGLVQHKNVSKLDIPVDIAQNIKVLAFKNKNDWNLVAKYTIGK